MKNLILIFFIILFSLPILNGQVKKPLANKNNAQLQVGIQLKNTGELTTDALSKAKIPVISINEKIKNAKPLTSWKIGPKRPKDNWLYLDGPYYGWYSSESWTLVSRPRVEGMELTGYYGSAMFLKFRQSKNIEYRMKIKLKPSSYRSGQNLHVQVNDFSGQYPVDPANGTVTVGWTANRSLDKASIVVGQLIKENIAPRRPFPETIIKEIKIDKISN